MNQLNEKYNDLEKQIQEKQAQFDCQFDENKKLQSDLVILIFKILFCLDENIIFIAIENKRINSKFRQ